MLHSGIDLHKRTVVFSTVDAQGARVAEAELPTSRVAVAGIFRGAPRPPSRGGGVDGDLVLAA